MDEYKLSHYGDVLSCGPASQFGQREMGVVCCIKFFLHTAWRLHSTARPTRSQVKYFQKYEAAKFFSVTQQKNHRLMELSKTLT